MRRNRGLGCIILSYQIELSQHSLGGLLMLDLGSPKAHTCLWDHRAERGGAQT